MSRKSEADDATSVDVDNNAYVGVSPEYKTHANAQDAPLNSEDEKVAALEQAALESEQLKANSAMRSDVNGYVSNTPHPSEATGPADRFIERNDKIVEAQASLASQHLEEANRLDASSDEEPDGATSGIAASS